MSIIKKILKTFRANKTDKVDKTDKITRKDIFKLVGKIVKFKSSFFPKGYEIFYVKHIDGLIVMLNYIDTDGREVNKGMTIKQMNDRNIEFELATEKEIKEFKKHLKIIQIS